ncbi:MAG: Kae1-associated kinase Bud32 [Candidatus Hadarchaeales archaeon]
MPAVLIKKGAEANLYLQDFAELFGYGEGRVVVKHRIPKRYRVREIDERLRRSRTLLEAKLLSEAKEAGVSTPTVYLVDRREAKLVMEFVEGERIKELLGRLGARERRELCRNLGRTIARLHKAGVVHGDLTTSNMIVRNGRIYLLDFGLSGHDSSVEARGVDLHLCRRALESTHFEIAHECYRNILAGYREEFGEGAGQIIKRAEEISKRGRYVPKEERVWR